MRHFCKGYENGAIGRLVLPLWENSFFSVIFKQVIELFWSDPVLSINYARYFGNVTWTLATPSVVHEPASWASPEAY